MLAIDDIKIAVIGLGYVGLPLAVEFGKYRSVIGFDIKDAAHPEGDIEVIFTGLRAGEKLYEELIIGEDNVESTDHPLIMQAIEHSFLLDELESVLFELTEKQKQFDVPWLKQQFKQYVDGYKENTE